eukprot:scaffold67819_cov23-Tisochrysis_lutea.AAC.1
MISAKFDSINRPKLAVVKRTLAAFEQACEQMDESPMPIDEKDCSLSYALILDIIHMRGEGIS